MIRRTRGSRRAQVIKEDIKKVGRGIKNYAGEEKMCTEELDADNQDSDEKDRNNMDEEIKTQLRELTDKQRIIREKKLANILPHQWKKGQSGNSLGRYMGGISGKERMKRKIMGMTDGEFEEFIEGQNKIDLFKMAEGNPATNVDLSGEITSKIIKLDE